MPVLKYLECSTAHLTERDNELLQIRHDCDLETTIIEDEYGYWIYTLLDSPTTWRDSFSQQAQSLGLSREFLTLLAHARQLHCKWLRLDQDADPLPELPKFEW